MRDLMEKLETVAENVEFGAAMEKAVHPVAAKLAMKIDHLFDAEFSDDFMEQSLAINAARFGIDPQLLRILANTVSSMGW